MIDEDEQYYRVPICMINDPVNYNADYVDEKLRLKEKPKEDKRINVRNM